MATITQNLLNQYSIAVEIPCDINEHVETLYTYARKCSSALELGTGQRCTASWGILRGLAENSNVGNTKKWMTGLDIGYSKNTETVAQVARENGVDYRFLVGSDLEVPLDNMYPEGVSTNDLTFIDTWHNYGQLKRELARFAPRTKKYIIMHDTEIDGVRGESVRMRTDIGAECVRTGIPVEEAEQGLLRAIDEFIEANPVWTVVEQRRNNNGLTVLEKS
jgi:hypothetical protein